jgi:hypothetical protein
VEEGEGVEEDDWGYVRLQTVMEGYGEVSLSNTLHYTPKRKACKSNKEKQKTWIYFSTPYRRTPRSQREIGKSKKGEIKSKKPQSILFKQQKQGDKLGLTLGKDSPYDFVVLESQT